MPHSPMLLSPYRLKGLTLKNRVTMAPLFLGYANSDGTAGALITDHYREMAASGAAMIVVENAAVEVSGLGSPFMLRVDDDRFIESISGLVTAIQGEGALAFLQINHAGRYAHGQVRIAPSPVNTWGVVPREMSPEDIDKVIADYAAAAARVKEAGFDGVEVHGGTGYLLVQFLSARTNHRTDRYGGTLDNRMRLPLQVVDAVMQKVGSDYPVGYRFLADECLPDGLHPEETEVFARELETRGVAYLSVMAGTYDSFFLPDYIEMQKEEGYMANFAGTIKRAVPQVPVVAAGRIQTAGTATKILDEGTADLIGLARVLFADPLWPRKVAGQEDSPIVRCEPTCSLCTERVIKGKPAFCARWEKARRDAFLHRVGEKPETGGAGI